MLKKCHVFINKTDNIEHVVRPRRLEIASHTTDAIKHLKKNAKRDRATLLCGNRKQLQTIHPQLSPYCSTAQSKTFEGPAQDIGPLNDEERKAMKQFQEKLILLPILALQNAKEHYGLNRDACNVRVGLKLLKEEPDMINIPIDYWSRSLAKPENACGTT